jgi:uncharacterized protein YggE
MTRSAVLTFFVVVVFTLIPPTARGAMQETEETPTVSGNGITVIGQGKARAKPNVVEIDSSITADAELASDAVVKYRGTKRRVEAGFAALKNPAISVEFKGYTISNAMDPSQQQMMMQGRTDVQVKAKVQVSEAVKIILKDVDKLEPDALFDVVLKIIDTGKDSGLQMGPPLATNYYQAQIAAQTGRGTSLVTFKISDPTVVREQAYQKAIEDAKSKAKHLADLGGVKLGRIVSITDSLMAKNANSQTAMIMAMYGMSAGGEPADLTSSVFEEIVQTQRLTVQFEIAR